MKLLLLPLLLSAAEAHNWLKSPASRNANKAATAKPCPATKAGYEGITAEPGATISTTWSTNHNGNHWIKMVKKDEEATLETAAEKIHDVGNKVASVDVTAPTEAGEYVMQYGWSGYRNCVDLTVAAAGGGAGGNTGGGADTGVGTPTDPGKDGSENLNCISYCADIMTACVGESAQYRSDAECKSTCAIISRAGTDGDTTGNTLQCRWYHLHVEGGANPAVHCPHAGPTGGGVGHCVGDEAKNPGVNIEIKVLDPAATTPESLKTLLEEAMTTNKIEFCPGMAPVLGEDNTYLVTVTFCKAGEHSVQPLAQAEALLTTAGSSSLLSEIMKQNGISAAKVDTFTLNAEQSPAAVTFPFWAALATIPLALLLA